MTNTKPLKRGRPPKDKNSSEVLPPVRVTPEQKVTYKKAADLAGISLSAWLKKAADEKSNNQYREEK
jgi:predicted HicB family RNase H-like nuclease